MPKITFTFAAFLVVALASLSALHAQSNARRLPRATAQPREVATSPTANTNENDSRMQQTPSVLLPGNYWDHLRAPLKAGEVAPDFSLPLARESRWKSSFSSNIEYSNDEKKGTTSEAREVTLSQLTNARDGVTVVVFWAFWCDTWKDVSGYFARMKPKLQAARALPLCVAVDASQQPVARKSFNSGRIWYPVAIDSRSEIVARWNVRRVPTIFLIDNESRIRNVWEGFPGEHTLMNAIGAARKPFAATRTSTASIRPEAASSAGASGSSTRYRVLVKDGSTL